MENLKAYIESGVLELYVLGDLSPEEALQVEEMASQNPEVSAEIAAIEQAMEQYAMRNAIEPAAHVEASLFNKLGIGEEEPIVTASNTETPNAPKIIKLESTNGNVKTLRYALVACIALLIISTGALIVTYSRLNDANDQIVSLNQDKQRFANVVNKLEFENEGLNNMAEMAESKEWATIRMAGQTFSPKSKMNVYWNKKDKTVLINYAAMDLPKTDREHEYQLWAMVNGKPVSLGVFGGKDSVSTEALRKMETIQNAQAFAVTIEPTGGSVNPTMEKLTVMGGV